MARMTERAQPRRATRRDGARDLHTASLGSGVLRVVSAALVAAVLLLASTTVSAWASTNKAPKVTHQPASVTAGEGTSAVFEATASGVPTPSVQWELSSNGGASWTPVAGATASILTIETTKSSENGDEYRAVFSNLAGSVTSKVARLTVESPPAITEQPANTTVELGQNAVFEAAASGVPTPTVQWQYQSYGGSEWNAITGATSDRLTVAKVSALESGAHYRAVFTNAAGTATSEAAKLTVSNPPTITKQPASVAVAEGQSTTLEATASGFPQPSEQWELSTDGGNTWTPVAGATKEKLTIASAKYSENGDRYRAVFTNPAGQVTSAQATLTVYVPPVLTEQPVGTTVEVGQSAAFEASATGIPQPAVQWERSTDGGNTWSPVSGATADRLALEDVQASQSGEQYRAVFTNTAGKTDSEAATLTVVLHDYRVVGWGQNSFGQLGDGNLLQSDAPTPVSGLKFVTAIAAGKYHSLALLANGTVVAWGADTSGQLGDGEEASSDVPVPVPGLTGVVAIAAGANQSLALLSNGTVMAWGGNESGQLGDGENLESEVPVAVKGLTGVTAIAAGGEHSLALLSDGTVMAWGENEQGQLGDASTKNSDVPVAVTGLSGVTAIAAGGEHSLALLSDGDVMAWGADEYGQLGNSGVKEHGEEEERFSEMPVAVEGLSGVSAIAAGTHHSLALLSDGTVMAWGENEAGELGDASLTRSEEVPVAVSGLTGVTAIAAGGKHSLALLSGGAVMTWGEDKNGELGNGSSGEPSDVPVAVTNLGQVVGIVAGGVDDLAYGEPLPAVTGVSPASGPVAGGTSVTITGSQLEGATAVHFGSKPATEFTVNSSSSITAVSPAGTLGTVANVTVTTPAGTSPTVAGDRFTYAAAPAVKSLSVKDGAGAGGTSVTITGSGFEGVTSVSFGANAATVVSVEPTSITALSPAGAGTVNVTVTGPGGTSATSKHDEFGYTPAVEGVEPGSGPAAGGTSVTVSGDGFVPGDGATSFKFGKKTATGVDCTSTTSCTMIAPANKAGTVEVTVAVGKLKGAKSPPEDEFTYE